MAYTTIKKPSDYFNTVTYTGDGTSSRNITGVGFQPDLLWIKNRDITQWHFLFDAVRGVSKALFSNVTNAESTQASTQTAFLSDGFTVGNDVASNGNGNGIVSCNWLGANGTASNTNGSITSTVSANTTSGFSIVKYTGTGANATVGHGLGVAPKMIIGKGLDNAINWTVGGSNISSNWTSSLALNSTGAVNVANYWQDQAPNTNTFALSSDIGVNANGLDFIAYCFAEKKGFSKFGSYTGNGSTDGTFIYTGFKPAMVIFKPTSTTGNWFILDNKRNTINPLTLSLFTNLSDAETGTYTSDFLSNGIKIRLSGNPNSSGVSYIYMAFAEEPLVGDNPATAR